MKAGVSCLGRLFYPRKKMKGSIVLALSCLVFAASAQASVVGSWFLDETPVVNDAAGGPIVITFFDNGYYHFGQDGSSLVDPSGQDGMEWGTYTYDGSDITFGASLDTNGDWGPGALPLSGNLSGDTLSIGGSDNFARIDSTGIVGGWSLDGVSTDSDEAISITFLPDNTFMLIHGNSDDPCNCGTPGIEYGTYAADEGTGAFSFLILTDTTGDFGLSDGALNEFTVVGDTLTLSDGAGDNVSFSRVSAVPVPAAVWLFGSALAGLGWTRRKRNAR